MPTRISLAVSFLIIFFPFVSYPQGGARMLEQLEVLATEGDFDGAIALEDKINALNSERDSLMADLYSYLAGAFNDGFMLEEAGKYFKRELAYRQQLNPVYQDELYDCVYNLTYVLEESGDINGALAYAGELHNISTSLYGDNAVESLEAVAWTVDLLISSSRYSEALKRTEAQLKTTDTENIYYPILLAKKGEIQVLQGNYESARVNIITASAMLSGLGMNLEALLTRSHLALSYVQQGKFAEAEVIFFEIRDGLMVMDDPLAEEALYDLYNNLTFTLVALGRYDEAMSLFNEILTRDESRYGVEHPDYLTSTINQGMVYVDMEDYQSAEAIFEKALTIDQKIYGNSGLVYATIMNNMANVYRLSGRYAAAIQAYGKAEEIFKSTYDKKRNPDVATVQFNEGKTYLAKRDKRALDYLRKSQKMRKLLLGESHPKYGEVVNYLGLYHWQQNQPDKAVKYFHAGFSNYFQQISSFFPVLSEEEKTSFYYGKLKPTFEQFNSFAWDNYERSPELMGDVYNYQLRTKGLIMYATERVRRNIYKAEDSLLVGQYEEWKRLKEQISKLYSTDATGQGSQIDSMVSAANTLERRLVQASSAFADTYEGKEITWHQIREQLKPGEAAMEVVRFRNFDPQQVNKFTPQVYYLGLIITPETTAHPVAVLLENGVDLEGKFLHNYRNAVRFQTEDTYSYGQYWKKFDDVLQGVEQLYFSADGVYNQININTLKNTETGDYLIREIKVRQITNTRELVLKKRDMGNSSNLSSFIGFPAYSMINNQEKGSALEVSPTSGGTQNDNNVYSITRGLRGGLMRYFRSNEGIVPIPGTKTEVEGIGNLYETRDLPYQVLLRQNASEKRVKELHNPKTLHIATHGFFLENIAEAKAETTEYHPGNPLLGSGLVLAGAEDFLLEGSLPGDDQDGILTSYEAMNLDLEGTDLVVLSACETGLGTVRNGEGVYGLQRAFRLAGAKSIVMSMWNVDDDFTQQFMRLFYQNWMDGMNRYQAFYSAQLSLLEKYRDPVYWGSFIIIGLDK